MSFRLGDFAGKERLFSVMSQQVMNAGRGGLSPMAERGTTGAARGAREMAGGPGIGRLVRVVFVPVLAGLILCSCLSSDPLGTPPEASPAMQRYEKQRIMRTNGTHLECYVSRPLARQVKALPLVFLCQGSGYGSVFEGLPMGGYIDIFGWFWDFGMTGDRIRLAFAEKRGVTVGTPLLEPGEADPPLEYLIHDKLENRVDDVVLALERLVLDPTIDRSRIAVAGFGEGAQVAAAAARKSPHATHLGFFACGGDAHINDILQLNRAELMRTGVTPEEAEEKTEELFEEIAEVFASPADVETLYGGVSYAHVISYWLKPPIEDLLALEIPIYVAVGNMDRFVPPASVDLIRLSFLNAGKTNLTLNILPGLDHSFTSHIYEGEDPSLLYQTPVIFDKFVTWFLGFLGSGQPK